MPAIQTVTGTTTPERLGRTLMHEHLVIGYPGFEHDWVRPGPKRDDMFARCIDRIEELKGHGVDALLDPCPADLGRDVEFMAKVAQRTRFTIICATGLYKEEEGANAYWKFRANFGDISAALGELFARELTDGIADTGIRAGIIKVGTGHETLTKYEQAVFAGAARAAVETGAPITTHTDGGRFGDDQQSFLVERGVPAHRIVIGHSCGTGDHAYHMRIAERGSYLGFDRFGLDMLQPDTERVAALLKLVRAGRGRQIVVSHDTVWCWRGEPIPSAEILSQMEKIWNPTHFLTRIVPKLRDGGASEADIEALLVDNPRRFFAGEPVGESHLKRTVAAAILLAAGLVPAGCAREAGPTTLDAGRLGKVELYAPEEPPTGFVFLFSDRDGPTRELRRTARQLAQSDTATLLVDLRAYLKGLAASDDGCHYLISELEELSKREQRELGAEGYHSPVLAGVGQGGTLAYAALAQSPAATVAGAVVVKPAETLATRVALCEGAKATADRAGGFRYAPSKSLPGILRVAANPGDALVEAIGTLIEEARSSTQEPSLEDLPLVLLPAENAGPLFAVIYSGDGGWRDLDKTIGEYLADHGVPTVGVDSLRYFWQTKTPEDVARDLVSILEVESARGGPQKAILIGYSFGADILPFVYNRLPDEWRDRVVQVSLLGLGSRAPFEFHMSGWLEQTDESALPVLPEILRMDLSKLQCFYGEEEDDIVCDKPELEKAEVIRTTGSHHFDGDYEKLAQRILEGAERRVRAQRTTTPVMPPAIKAATSASTKAAASPPGAAR